MSRRATHSGSWYSESATVLSKELDKWLGDADLSHGPARAIIAPHAGYTFCGACGAHAYRQVSPAVVKRVFILGPAHYYRLRDCALTTFKKYETPFYDLKIDSKINAELEATGQFQFMDKKTDEEEHSIEMILPYIAKVMEDFKDNFTIIPILVGSLSRETETIFGDILSPYLADPQNLFIVSSDFCHWGSRFRYTNYDKSCGPIYKSIERMDKDGMNIIERLTPNEFSDYLKSTNNTICGRYPIGVMLRCAYNLQREGHKLEFKFLNYAQSSQCVNLGDSSVSYAAGSLIIE